MKNLKLQTIQRIMDRVVIRMFEAEDAESELQQFVQMNKRFDSLLEAVNFATYSDEQSLEREELRSRIIIKQGYLQHSILGMHD